MEEIKRYDLLDDNNGKPIPIRSRQSPAAIGISEKGKCVMLKDVLDRVYDREYKYTFEDLLWLEDKLKFVESFPSGSYYTYNEVIHRADKIKKKTLTKEMVIKEIKLRINTLKKRLGGRGLEQDVFEGE